MKTLSPLIERIEADIMASDLLHADDTPIRVLDRSRRDKRLGKGVKQGRIWAMCAINALGWGHRHWVLSLALRPFGRKSMFSAISPKPTASFKLSATRVMPSSTSLAPMARSVCAKRHVGLTYAETSTTFGRRPNPILPARRSTGSVSSTILNATSSVSPLTPVMRRVKI